MMRGMVDRAMIVATVAFRDDGDALDHAQRVAQLLPARDRVGRTVALLHDVVEDTSLSIERMRGWFPDRVLAAVEELTRRDGEPYFEYVRRVAAGSDLARRVKLADATDNLQRSVAGGNEGFVSRYTRVLQILSEE